MPPPVIVDLSEVDLNTVIADREAIEKLNPQRFEMSQLDAVCLIDSDRQLIIGYKDVKAEEFWTRGHFPESPILPGVLICETAAQLTSYYSIMHGVIESHEVGFGGMDNVRFRAKVLPGDRLVLVGQAKRLRRIQTVFNVQGFVGSDMVFHGDLIGVSLPKGKG